MKRLKSVLYLVLAMAFAWPIARGQDPLLPNKLGVPPLPEFVGESSNLVKVLDRIRELIHQNDHAGAQVLISATLREFGDSPEYALYMRQFRREQNNLWYAMAQQAMKDKDYERARSLQDRYRAGLRRELEDSKRHGQPKGNDPRQDISLVGKLVTELDEAKKNLAETRARKGEPGAGAAPNHDENRAKMSPEKKELLATAEKLFGKAKQDAANGHYQLARAQINEALAWLPKDASTITLISSLYKEKERVVWLQIGEAMQKGEREKVSKLLADFQRIGVMRRDAQGNKGSSAQDKD